MATLRRLCPAKVNLYLKVLERRADGYHELVTVMQPLSLADELVLSPRPEGLGLRCNSAGMPQGEENLVWRAARKVAEAVGRDLQVNLTLRKNIPIAAGLGGGSSDAAGTLLALNAWLGHPLGYPELYGLASQLGADVPFFLGEGPAVGRGIGTEITPLRLPPYWYMLANPGIPISTRWVYENLDLDRLGAASPASPAEWDKERPESWLHNDLETVTMVHFPEIGGLMRALVELGARGARMSGSGPTIFGLFDEKSPALEAARVLRRTFDGWLAVARGLTGGAGEGEWENQVWMV